jgi:hypothetical protein
MAYRIKLKAIKVRCPYCANAPFRIECPGEAAPGKEIDDRWTKESFPKEIEYLPYTRDIGVFDDKGWTKIGSDFHSKILDWERVGILRKKEGQKVFYRVVLCPQCKHSFEVYINYTPGMSFADMWPHLFGKNQDNDIKKYNEVTLTQRIIGNKSLSILFVCFIFLISFVPDIAWKWETLRASGGLELFIVGNWVKLLMRGISCLSLLCILQISFSFISYLEGSGFENLFKINDKDKKRSLTYWKNYTRARFVGVQNKEEPFSPTQVMIIAGIPTVAVLLLIWLYDQAIKAEIQSLALFIILLLVPIFYAIGIVAQALCSKIYYNMKTPQRQMEFPKLLPIQGGGILASIIGLFGSVSI